jgi:lipopolysaccharide export system protein LptA
MRTFLIAILFFVPVLLAAQQIRQDTLSSDTPQKKKIRILNSDTTYYIESDTGTISRLYSNIEIEHEGFIMTCDSAVLWRPSGIFEAYGNTKVTNGATVITGDTMIYSESTGKANVRGRIVYLTDGSSTLRTTNVDFNTGTEIGYFEYGGTIVDSFRTLESQKGYYYSKIKEFEFIGQVQSDTKDYVLQSDSMKYNTDTKIFTFYSNTHIWSENGYLYCDRGWYDSDKDIVFFYRNSYMMTPKQEVFADSIYYESNSKKGRLYSKIQVTDTVQKTVALADYADFDMNTEDFLMHKNPSIILYDDKDSVFIRADTLYSKTTTVKMPINVTEVFVTEVSVSDTISPNATEVSVTEVSVPDIISSNAMEVSVTEVSVPDTISPNATEVSVPSNIIQRVTDTIEYVDSTYKELFAFKNVKLYRNDFQLICDSMYFNNLDSIWKTYHNSILWDGKKMQITADSMKFYMINGELDHADFNSNAMVVIPEGNPDSTVFFDQIKSKNMKAHFEDRQLTLFEAMGNVQTLAFFMSDFIMNKTESATLKIFFQQGKVYKLGYYGNPDTYNNQLFRVREDEIKLPGYRWEINLRPKSGTEILNRPLCPSERAVRELITQPSFPITKRIDEIEQKIKHIKD